MLKSKTIQELQIGLGIAWRKNMIKEWNEIRAEVELRMK